METVGPKGGNFLPPFFIFDIFIDMKNIVLTEKQIIKLKEKLNETHHEGGSYMAKQQLFTIATLAYSMWENMEDGEQLEDWMESKIAQAEQSVVSVVKTYMYKDVTTKEVDGTKGIDLDDIVIGQ